MERNIALMRSRAPLNGQHPELNRSNVLYLLRVASLTRMNNGAMELTPTGAHFNIKQRQLPRYTNNYAGKFGYTKDPARVRFNTFVSHCQATGFPERLEPVFEMAIIGIPPRRLHQMEHGLRNFLDREEVRLQLHSRSTFIYPENTNMFTERHEFAQTDEQGGGLFDLFDNFTRHLERGRRRAVDAAREADIRQSRAIEARKAPMCIEHQRIHNHKLDEFFRIEQAHWQALAGQPEHVAASIARIESDTPRVNVWAIEHRALCVAAQMLEPLE
ncbi:hypothetical protein P3T76_011870 [Phytophthora citrophthora]|uniref:Uncharacterized protein n=1 Tax=Phytophthora citrophthora TaxID=4793 RepID=A0AAD9G847_9STRA|nr:hypothetical protein P3T76_011870 [Phytophthora citrophthora]